jgi:hypothetical protein
MKLKGALGARARRGSGDKCRQENPWMLVFANIPISTPTSPFPRKEMQTKLNPKPTFNSYLMMAGVKIQ